MSRSAGGGCSATEPTPVSTGAEGGVKQGLTPGTGKSYMGDILLGLLVFGPGLGARYVPGSIASLAGVADEAKSGWPRSRTASRPP
jgi:hypothetical protein